MKQEEFDFIKDAFSQILDDIAGNPDWHDAASAVSADLGALERELEGKVVSPGKSLEEAAGEQAKSFGYMSQDVEFKENVESFIAGAEWQKEELKDDIDFAKQLKVLRELQRRSKLDEFIEVRYHEGMSKALFTTAIKSAFEMGMEQQKEQMLKEAVEAKTFYLPFGKWRVTALVGKDKIEEDDKVRIVVLKAEEK